MAEHNIFGKEGEEAAVGYLEKQGYIIRHRNWRRGHLELDIVAFKDDELIVAEVKTRRNTDFALPEAAVDKRKIRKRLRRRTIWLSNYLYRAVTGLSHQHTPCKERERERERMCI